MKAKIRIKPWANKMSIKSVPHIVDTSFDTEEYMRAIKRRVEIAAINQKRAEEVCSAQHSSFNRGF